MDGPSGHSSTLSTRIFGEKPVLHIPTVDDEADLKGIKGIHLYGPRQVGIFRHNDIAVLPLRTREAVRAVLDAYSTIGLPHIPFENIAFVDYDEHETLGEGALKNRAIIAALLDRHPEVVRIIPFFHSQNVTRLAKEHGLLTETANYESINDVNDKWLSQVEWRQRGIITCEGELVHSVKEASRIIAQLRAKKYSHICLKKRRSVSGAGVKKLAIDEATAYLQTQTKLMAEQGLIIEPWFNNIDPRRGSPSIQMYIGNTPDKDVVICSTQQILGGKDDTEHKGNNNDPTVLADETMQTQVQLFCDWARDEGFRGIAGVDLLNTDGVMRFSDPNMRQTGATAGALLAHKATGNVRHTPWGVRNNCSVQTSLDPADFIKALKSRGLLYSTTRVRGIIPTNLATVSAGKAMFVAVGHDENDRDKLIGQVEDLFNIAA